MYKYRVFKANTNILWTESIKNTPMTQHLSCLEEDVPAYVFIWTSRGGFSDDKKKQSCIYLHIISWLVVAISPFLIGIWGRYKTHRSRVFRRAIKPIKATGFLFVSAVFTVNFSIAYHLLGNVHFAIQGLAEKPIAVHAVFLGFVIRGAGTLDDSVAVLTSSQSFFERCTVLQKNWILIEDGRGERIT